MNFSQAKLFIGDTEIDVQNLFYSVSGDTIKIPYVSDLTFASEEPIYFNMSALNLPITQTLTISDPDTGEILHQEEFSRVVEVCDIKTRESKLLFFK